MATYKQRADGSGLVDVQTDTGAILPMTEDQAKAGGATPEQQGLPGLAALTPPGAPLAPSLGPNPYSMIGSGQAIAEGPTPGLAQATNRSMSDATSGAVNPAAALAPTAPVPKTKEQELDDAAFGAVGNFFSGAGKAINRFLTRPVGKGPAIEAAQRKWDEEHAAQAEPAAPAAPAPTPAAASPDAGKSSAPAREGGYQLDQQISVIGGGMQPESQTVRHGLKIGPDLKRELDRVNPDDIRNTRVNDALNVYNDRQRALEAEDAEIERQRIENEERKQEIARRRAAIQERMDTIDKREAEAAKATPQSRSEILSSRSGLSRMFSALSMMMGAKYQGLTGRNNPGLDLFNQSIADEIAGQRAKYEAAKDKVAMANTDFGKAMQLYGDPNVAEADLMARAYTLGKNIAQNHWKRAETEQDYNTQKWAADELAQKAAEWKQTAYERSQAQIVDTYKREAPQVLGVLDDKDLARLVHVEGYGNGFVGNPAQQVEIAKRMTAAATALNYFDQLEALQKKGEFMNDLDKRNAIEGWGQAALSAMSEAAGQGVVTEADAKNAKQILNNPNAFFSSGITALLATRDAMRLRMDNTVRDTLFADPRGRTRLQRQRADSFKPGLPQ